MDFVHLLCFNMLHLCMSCVCVQAGMVFCVLCVGRSATCITFHAFFVFSVMPDTPPFWPSILTISCRQHDAHLRRWPSLMHESKAISMRVGMKIGGRGENCECVGDLRTCKIVNYCIYRCTRLCACEHIAKYSRDLCTCIKIGHF